MFHTPLLKAPPDFSGGVFLYFINISHFSSIMKATNDESVHTVSLWTLKWRVRSCSYNRQSPIFLEKERGIWSSFWFSSWSSLACISVFHWCKWEENWRTTSNNRRGPVLLWPVNKGISPLLWRKLKRCGNWTGWDPWFLNMKVPFVFLVKKRWRDSSR